MPGKILLILLGVISVGVVTSFVALERQQFRRAAAFWLGWLFPGLGHIVMGRWKKGLFFAAALSTLLGAGLWICGGRVVGFEENPFYFCGQFGSGLTALAGVVFSPDRPFRA